MRGWPALVFFCCACGIDESGLLPSSSNDASIADVVAVDDDAGDAQPPKEAGPPQACSIDAGACVATVPSGWELVAFDPANENACPSNYASASVIWNVSTLPGACDCACNPSAPPACDVGAIQRFISADNTCNQTGNTFTASGPGCTLLLQGQIGPLSAYSKSSPIAPSGGVCSGNAVKKPVNVAKNVAALCTVPPSCQEQFCGGAVPGGFQSCIQTSGAQQTCPAGWSNPVLVGDDVSYDCSSCSCDFGGTTCTNASLTFYSDLKCATPIATTAVDGQCDADPGSGQTPLSWTYKATTNVVCNATGPKTASNLQLANERTICCK